MGGLMAQRLGCFNPAAEGGSGDLFVGGKTHAWAGSTSNTTISLTDLTGGLASAPAENDIVIIAYAICSAGANPDVTVATSGYTELCDLNADDSRDANLGVYYKVMGGSPDTSVDVGPTPASDLAGAVAIHVWRGIDTVTPIDVTTTTATGINFGRPNPPSITPSTSGAIILAAGSMARSILPDAFTSALDHFLTAVGDGGNGKTVVGLGSHDWAGGAYDPVEWGGGSDASTASWTAATLALRPA